MPTLAGMNTEKKSSAIAKEHYFKQSEVMVSVIQHGRKSFKFP